MPSACDIAELAQKDPSWPDSGTPVHFNYSDARAAHYHRIVLAEIRLLSSKLTLRSRYKFLVKVVRCFRCGIIM